jgi:hypothetical protein
MVSFGLRSVMATSLSLWLGLLACLLGCAKPAAAATMEQGQWAGMGVCPERDSHSQAGDSCCQHGHDDSSGSEKNSHHAKSCCPTETALTQKNSLAAAAPVSIHIAALTLPNFDVSGFVSASQNAGVPALWHTGRDILRQVHVLRI